MPRSLQLEAPVGRQRGFDPVDRVGKPRSRLQHVEFGGGLHRAVEVFRPPAKRVGQREQDSQDLFVLLLLEGDDVVVDLDRAERLEKQARTARRRTVHDARDGPAVLGFDDEHVAAVALGDHLVLQVLGRVPSAEERLERAAQPSALLAQTLTDRRQLRARVVDDLAGRIDRGAGLGGFVLERRRGVADGREARKRARRAADGRAGLVNRVEKRRQREQAQRFERAPLDRERSQYVRQRVARAQREPGACRQVARRLARVRQPLGDFLPVGRRRELRQTLCAHRRHGKRLDGFDDPVELEGPKGAWLHT